MRLALITWSIIIIIIIIILLIAQSWTVNTYESQPNVSSIFLFIFS